jgi:HTH-type transcriptional regulator/antitoxin HipB
MSRSTDDVFAALRAARERKAISQRELSAKTGIPQAQISRLERGTVDIRLSSLVSLARALGLEVALVPRSAMPAVDSIVRQSQRQEPPRAVTDRCGPAGTGPPKCPPQATCQRCCWNGHLGHVRMLERMYPAADQLSAIEAFGRFLQRAATADIDPAGFATHAKTIEQLRDQLAQVPPAAPKQVPAYALDEDDDD